MEAHFRPLKRGFSVWLYEDNSNVAVPRWRKIGGSTHALSWRTAFKYLVADPHIRVFGDLWFETRLNGLPKRTSDILRLAIIVDDESAFDYLCIGNLLLGFTDDEIRAVVPSAGL